MLYRRMMNFRTLLLVVELLDLHVKSCPENQFQLPDGICCDFCEEGWYLSKNCTRSGNSFIGVMCSPCSVCAKETQVNMSCSRFSDTQCTPSNPETSTTISKTEDELQMVHMALSVIVPVVLIAITVAVGYKLSSRRCTFRDPAAEPLKTMI